MNRSVLTILFILSGISLFSQQPTEFTQYMLNKTYINPGATGSSDALCITGIGRDQWIGLKDESGWTINPRTYQISAEIPIYSIHSGLGISFEHDMIGFEKNTDVRLNYAYQLRINKFQLLSLGITGEYMSKFIDFSQFNIFDQGDPILAKLSVQKGNYTDFGFGVFYRYTDRLYAGISGMQLLGSSAIIGGAKYTRIPSYYFMVGADFWLNKSPNTKLALSPGILAKSSIFSTQVTLNMLLRYNEKYWSGIMFRPKNAAGVIAGVKFNNFSIGLSYDYTLSEMSKTGSKGSLEILLRYCLPLNEKVKMKGYYNPRYL